MYLSQPKVILRSCNWIVEITTFKMKELMTRVFWTTWVSSFTIEFALMFSKMSHGVLGVLRTDLALDKVNRYSGSRRLT